MKWTALFLNIVSCVNFTTSPYSLGATARVEATDVSFALQLQPSALVQAIRPCLHLPFLQLSEVGDVQVRVRGNECQCHGVAAFKLQCTPQLWTQFHNDALTADVFSPTFQMTYRHFVLPVGLTAMACSSHGRTSGSFASRLRKAGVRVLR